MKKTCQKKKDLHAVWHVKGEGRLPKFGCAIFCTKMTARVITHKIKLAKVGKISNHVPRFIATMPQLCFLALGRVLFGSCCEVALPIFAGWTYKVHCPASTAKSKTATSWSSISQRLSFQCRLSVWGLTTTAFLEGCFSATIGSQDNMRVSSMRLSI